MHARVVSSGVRIRTVSHVSVVTRESPGVAHPATTATVGVVGLAEHVLVCLSVGGAIDELLLGKTHWGSSLLDRDCSLKGGVTSESPA